MSKKTILLFLIASTFFMVSCSDRSQVYKPSDYINWINNPENNLISEHKSDTFTYSIQYRPTAYLALMESGSPEIQIEEFQELEKSLSGQEQFLFRVSLSNGESNWLESGTKNFNDFDEQINYLSFVMQKDFKLVKDQDTIDCSMFHFERDYGIRPFGTFLLGFYESTEKPVSVDSITDKSLKVIFTDSAFEDEIVEFNFSSNDIKKIPTLKL